MWYTLGWRLFRRELGRGELTIIGAAAILAVFSVVVLSGISSRIQGAMLAKSAGFIAADRVLQAGAPVDETLLTSAPLSTIQTSELVMFRSMVFSGDNMQLASVKAASDGYPLRGELKVKTTVTATESRVEHAPAPGEVWVGPRLIFALNAVVGSSIELGDTVVKIAGVIDEEPDAPLSSFATSPRVIMNIADVEQANVIQPGSRVTYRYLFAGEEADIKALMTWMKPKLRDNQITYGVTDREGRMSEALVKAEQFLLFAGLLGIVLASVAIAVAAQRYTQRQFDVVAIVKTLGGSRKQIRGVYLFHLMLVTVTALVIGIGLGVLAQELIIQLLHDKLPKNVPALGAEAILLAILTGSACSFVFSLFPLLRLFDIPPLRVLRRNVGEAFNQSFVHLAVCGATVFGLMWLYSKDLQLTTFVFAAGIFVVVFLLAVSRLILKAGRNIGMKPSSPVALAMASLQRRAQSNSIQLITFTLAIQLLLTLFILRHEMISEWQEQLPSDAPNHFLVNIAPHDLADVQDYWQAQGAKLTDAYPVVMGRLSSINGESLKKFESKADAPEQAEQEAKDDKDPQDQRDGIGRELNLTWYDKLPSKNEVVEGQWFGKQAKAEVSVESSLAERMGIALNDELTFTIGSLTTKVKVTSIRTVEWNSMQPNFYMILSPDALQGFPATYITAMSLANSEPKTMAEFARNYSSITMINVDQLIEQIRSVIEQVSAAIAFVFILVVIAGVLVLSSQVQASIDERRQEMVILRTLGAKGSLIKSAAILEFMLLGLLAGGLATIIAEGLLMVLQSQVFSMTVSLHPALWWLGPIGGGLVIALLGWLFVGSLLRTPTAKLIRDY